MYTVITHENVCCGQDRFVDAEPYCYGPCGAGEGYNGRCSQCGKEWEIDASTIAEIIHQFEMKEVETGVISEDLTVGKLIHILSQFDSHTPVDSIRLKGASNIVYAASHECGLVMCD